MLFLISRYLIFWLGWPSLSESTGHYFLGSNALTGARTYQGLIMLGIYIATIIGLIVYTFKTPLISLTAESKLYSSWTSYFIRAAFWAIFLTGLADAVVSFLRVENFLEPLVGSRISSLLDQARTRGTYLHYPLIAISFVIAAYSRSLGFMWLAALVVIAEFGIVISRFVFSYEQAFMGDLVRYWYAALFLFSSAYTLVEGGHVRVDVLYEKFSARGKAWTNALGSLFLGLPVCWTILSLGMSSKQSSLIAPIINFEVSQSGYGMYVKYLMAGFLIVFAVSMAMQFTAYFLSSVHVLTASSGEESATENEVQA